MDQALVYPLCYFVSLGYMELLNTTKCPVPWLPDSLLTRNVKLFLTILHICKNGNVTHSLFTILLEAYCHIFISN